MTTDLFLFWDDHEVPLFDIRIEELNGNPLIRFFDNKGSSAVNVYFMRNDLGLLREALAKYGEAMFRRVTGSESDESGDEP